MKFILLSDFHITSKQPRSRIGNIIKDFKAKLRFIFKMAEDNNADILQAGDLFNSPRDISALYEFLKVRSKFSKIKIYSIFGQHDSYFRNQRVLNNLSILEKANQIILLKNKPIQINNINLYGCNWGDDIPKPEKDKFNILVIHKSINDKPLFPGHEYTNAISFLKNNEFNLILTGDIHQKFIKSKYERIIVNTGPILRREFNEYNLSHKPQMFLFDTREPNCIETIYIPHNEAPFDSRFKIDDDLDLIDEDIFKILSEENTLTIYNVMEELINSHKNKKSIISIINKLENNYES